MSYRHEIVIIGGGLVGASLAIALARGGVDVALVEAETPEAFDAKADYDLRVSAISASSQQWLERIAVWPLIAGQRHCPYRHMRVWESSPPTSPAELRFGAPDSQSALGVIVENRLMLDALWQRLEGVTVYSPTRLESMDIDSTRASLTLTSHERLECQLVIGADGAQSLVRALAGISAETYGYAQRGIVANVSPSQPHEYTAWQRFLPTGPLAFLPLADGRCSIVWSLPQALAEDHLAMDDAQFCRALGEAAEGRLGEIRATSRRASFPLLRLHVDHYVRPRIALVGDAAHIIHPLAGQGVNLGFQDVAELHRQLMEPHCHGKDLGALPPLRRYARARRTENAQMLTLTDGLFHLFGNEHNLLGILRRSGLEAVNQMAHIKRWVERRAAGA